MRRIKIFKAICLAALVVVSAFSGACDAPRQTHTCGGDPRCFPLTEEATCERVPACEDCIWNGRSYDTDALICSGDGGTK